MGTQEKFQNILWWSLFSSRVWALTNFALHQQRTPPSEATSNVILCDQLNLTLSHPQGWSFQLPMAWTRLCGSACTKQRKRDTIRQGALPHCIPQRPAGHPHRCGENEAGVGWASEITSHIIFEMSHQVISKCVLKCEADNSNSVWLLRPK